MSDSNVLQGATKNSAVKAPLPRMASDEVKLQGGKIAAGIRLARGGMVKRAVEILAVAANDVYAELLRERERLHRARRGSLAKAKRRIEELEGRLGQAHAECGMLREAAGDSWADKDSAEKQRDGLLSAGEYALAALTNVNNDPEEAVKRLTKAMRDAGYQDTEALDGALQSLQDGAAVATDRCGPIVPCGKHMRMPANRVPVSDLHEMLTQLDQQEEVISPELEEFRGELRKYLAHHVRMEDLGCFDVIGAECIKRGQVVSIERGSNGTLMAKAIEMEAEDSE